MNDASLSEDSQPSISLFVDTNFFLQLRVPKELRWSDILPNGQVVLIVPRAVQKEVGRLKSDGNSRRSKRARSAAALLMRIAESPEEAEVVQERHPRVELRLASRSPATSVVNSELDPNNPDDKIIGEVLGFQAANQGRDVRFLTTDSDQVLSAKHFGIRCLAIPESWCLAPEQDERDKRIAEQRLRIAELEQSEPTIEIAVLDGSENSINSLSCSVLDFPPLSDDIVNRLVSEATHRNPVAEGLDELVAAKKPEGVFDLTLLAANPLSRFRPVTEEEVVEYRDTDYPFWVESIRRCFQGLHEELAVFSHGGSSKKPLFLA